MIESDRNLKSEAATSPVDMNRIARCFTAWIALAAFVFATLAPSVAHAFEARRLPAIWVHLCSADGPRMIELTGADHAMHGEHADHAAHAGDDGQAGGDAHEGHEANGGHCLLCFLTGAPPRDVSTEAGLAPATATTLPYLFLRAPRTLFTWATSQPRAPPQAA
ncbi:DUF2946 domain-containing protein [Cupriavidus respiraculi]|uniref:DUF2946 domain-containing protein n=2 Tax=Cupriavidus respiraculi TaxID=195930 RepID=A0ABM8WUK9_9BURK|nr:hypothetical protein LMG21510_01571 [Cupriavidus respiraculi]